MKKISTLKTIVPIIITLAIVACSKNDTAVNNHQVSASIWIRESRNECRILKTLVFGAFRIRHGRRDVKKRLRAIRSRSEGVDTEGVRALEG
jgi:hypothetical protein